MIARAVKPISREAVPAALQKARRYRVLNDRTAAESICLDVLSVDPANTDALVMHVLAITDRCRGGHADVLRRAEDAVRVDRRAMEHFEKAEALRPAGKEESILRWNTWAGRDNDIPK